MTWAAEGPLSNMEHVGGFVIHELVQESQVGTVIYDRGVMVQPYPLYAATVGG